MTTSKQPSSTWRTFGLLSATLLAVNTNAAFIADQQGTLILNFRDAGNTKNLGVNLGAASSYPDVGSTFSVAAITSAQLSTFFGGSLNNVRFSIAGFQDDAANLTTLWMSQPTLGVAYDRKKDTTQNNTRLKISSVEAGLNNFGVLLGGSTTAASMDPTLGQSYSKQVLNAGGTPNWADKFQGSVEGITGANFSTAVSVELYELAPWTLTGAIPTDGTEDAKLMGTFTLKTDGAMTYTPATIAVPEADSLAFAAVLGGLGFFVSRIYRARA